MPLYLDLLILLNFLVDFLLLMGANRLAGFPTGAARAALAAVLGGLYGGACVLPGFVFLGNTLWRLVSLVLMAVIAYGWNRNALRRGVLFCLLSMALGGIALGISSGSFGALVGAAGGVCAMCLLGFRGTAGGAEYVTVQIRDLRITALRDTGNTLTDPLTGQSVLVLSPKAGERLLGLTHEELRHPVETLTGRPALGLRLVPYHTVGQGAGMLIAKRFEDVRIGQRCESCLVAFSAEEIGRGQPYEALTGGAI